MKYALAGGVNIFYLVRGYGVWWEDC